MRNEGIYLVPLLMELKHFDQGMVFSGLFACPDKRVTEIPVKPGLNGLKASYAPAHYIPSREMGSEKRSQSDCSIYDRTF